MKKTSSAATVYFAYDEAGHLIGEYDGTGALLEETVWFGDIPVATLRLSGGGAVHIYYVHTDHLNAPRRVSDSADNTIVWRWDSEPYGASTANEDPDGDMTAFTYNLRFPGQYFDVETGLHYNYLRDYDPTTGRYAESDKIGLFAGSWSTYLYVNGNPLMYRDRSGLYATPWHGLISSLALLLSGEDPLTALETASEDMDFDFNWHTPGTQDPSNANWHSMARPGQSPLCAKAGSQDFINWQVATGKLRGLGAALHANEDSYDRGHGDDHVWYGGWPSWRHLLADWLPTPSELWKAFSTDRTIIKSFENHTAPFPTVDEAACGCE